MNILITGATGFVGSVLTQKLIELGHKVSVLTRNPQKAYTLWSNAVTAIPWQAPYGEIPTGSLSGTEVVINLMGENIGGKRWSEAQKKKLYDSRIIGTNKLKQALKRDLNNTLQAVISTSAIGYYPVNLEAPLSEDHASGNGFLADLCQEWEKAALEIEAKRHTIFRVGVVLGRDGGALAKLLPIFKMGLGGPVLPGSQMMSWIHRDDLVKLYLNAVTQEQYQGIINAVAPNPVSNKTFSKALGESLHRPALFPVPGFALKALMGEMSTIVLDSQTVLPTHLQELKHEFLFSKIDEALKHI